MERSIRLSIMDNTQEKPSGEMIGLEELREFIRTSRSPVIPEKVADLITERALVLEFPTERIALLNPLIEDLQERLVQRNISLPLSLQKSSFLSTKEQKMVRSLGVLQAQVADGLLRCEQFSDALTYAGKAATTCRIAKNYWLLTGMMDIQAIAMRGLGDYTGALEKQKESHRVGVEQNNPDIIQRSLYNQSVTLQKLGRTEESLVALYHITETHSSSEESQAVQGMAYNRVADGLMGLNDVEGAIEAAHNGLKCVESSFPTTRISLLIALANAYKVKGDYVIAFEKAKEGLLLARELEDERQTIRILVLLGSIQTELGDINEAKTTYEEALEICAKLGYTVEFERAQIVLSLARIFAKNGESDKAFECYRQLSEENQPWQTNPDHYSWFLANAADLHVAIEQFSEAEQMYTRALKICRDASILRGISGILLKLGAFYGKQGKREESLEAYKEVLNLSEAEIKTDKKIEASRALADLYQEAGEMGEALKYLNICFELTVQTKDMMLDNRLNQLRVRQKVEQHQKEAELERQHREQVEKELQQTTVALVEKSELIVSLRSKVEGILREMETSEIPVLNKALQRIIRHVSESDDMSQKEVLLLHSVSERFYSELRKRHPNLTTGQTKLCGLLRSGMDKQDILNLLHISLDGLHKQRYRLRQRLGLQTSESLDNYLASIGVEDR